MKSLKRQSQKGFTLIEMLVVAPIVILAIGAFLTVIISMTGEVIASRASNNLSYNVQDALNRIEQDVKLSSSFLASNNVMGTNQGYNNDNTGFTNIGGTSGTSLILNMVATTNNPISANAGYVFLKNKPNDCAAPQGNTPFTYNVVYFVKDETLFRRTIMPLNYNDTTNTVCVTPWQQPSCAPSFMDVQTSSTFCKTKDIELVRGVTPENFSLQYFNGEAATAVNAPASNAPVAADRNTALQSATTVGVAINAQQSAGGRTVERAAILRASRLDSNASAIAVISADTAPPSPKVSSSTSEPTTAKFTWPKIATAAGYTFEYRINNTGPWVVGFTNQPMQTFTVTTATHKDIVSARVTAINSIGNSGYGTSTVTIPLWSSLELQNGWSNYSAPYTTAGYTKTSSGVIVLKGMVKGGSGIIGVLPPGYRPSMYISFGLSSGSAFGRVNIQDDGAINATVASSSWYSLDGISFMPASTTFTAPSFLNSWSNYSPSQNALWQGAGYMTDSLGRVHTTGLIRAGTVASGTPMFNLPAAVRPPQYLHFLNMISNGMGHFSIDTSGNVLAKGYTNSYSSLQAMYYPAGRATGTDCTTQWCALPFQNGWKHYGGIYATPQYTKSADGIVILKGLVNGGSAATAPIATLPAGFCPAEQLLLATTSNAAWSRIDVVRNANGTCSLNPGAGATTTYIALDSIHYIAEP